MRGCALRKVVRNLAHKGVCIPVTSNQRFSLTPLGLAFCFFRFSNTHTPG